MSLHIIGHCPVCQNELIATKLSCHHCGLELSNDFSLNRFSFLSEEELDFVTLFIQHSGNLKEIQKQLHLSYPAAKKRLTEAQAALGFPTEASTRTEFEPTIKNLPIYKDESKTIQTLKAKLNQAKGIATIPLPKGDAFQIYYEEFGNGICTTNLPHQRILTWKAFDAAVELLERHGGQAPKGNAMKGKLGSTLLPLDSVEGYVAHQAYGYKRGDSCLRIISPLSAILEWCGICINGYGYLILQRSTS
ncbi:MAG: hypothetical protein PWP24_1497 [Clostridiales bacterium]|nr:hypothetical protein [Clostridiales bacterium]